MKGEILVTNKYSKEILELLLDIILDYTFYTHLIEELFIATKDMQKIIKKHKDVYGKIHEELNLFKEFSNVEKTRNNEVIGEL